MQAFLNALWFGLKPPRDGASNPLYRWRVTVAVIVMANTLGFLGLSAVAFGMVPMVFHGFAHADDVQGVKQQFARVQINQLDTKILDTRTRQCAAIISKNESALQFATERLQQELNDYQTLNDGHRYRLPGCEEL